MKTKSIFLFALALLNFSVAMAQPTPRPITVSPEIHADNSVTFRFYAPKATDVKLNAQFEKTPLPMTKDDKGVWSITTNPVKPDMYPYAFNVDGISVAAPNHTAIFPH